MKKQDRSFFHKFFDIYGNERQETWKLLLTNYDGKPPDTGLHYPDSSWWADPDLLTGNEYDKLMMWLTEPTVHSSAGTVENDPPTARIAALRGIHVESVRSIYIPDVPEHSAEKWARFYEIIGEYEPKILKDEYLSFEDIESNVKSITLAGKFYNLETTRRLTPFRFRRPPMMKALNRKFAWVRPHGLRYPYKVWVEIPTELYYCATVADTTLIGPERHKNNIGVILSRFYSGNLPPLDEELDNLIRSYQKILDERK